MSGRDDGREDLDARLERELRGMLKEREPGPVPHGLRDSVDRVPGQEASVGYGLRPRVTAILGLAAAVVMLFVGLQVLSVHQQVGPGASPSPRPMPTFDPTLEGPGIIRSSDLGVGGLLILTPVLALVAGIGFTRRRPLRLALGAAAIAVSLAAVTVANVPGPGLGGASGPGLGTEWAVMPIGFQGQGLLYVRVGPAERYSFGFSIRNDGPLPIRLEGIVDESPHGAVLPLLTALWVDGEPHGGSSGPATPFTARDLAPGDTVVLWLVARASPCAAGPKWSPTTYTSGYGRSTVMVRYSVLGWPRADDVALPYQVYEPIVMPCPPGSQ